MQPPTQCNNRENTDLDEGLNVRCRVTGSSLLQPALIVALLASLLVGVAQRLHAQAAAPNAAVAGRQLPPTGAEIASAARAVTLDHAVAAGATMFSRPFRFTPARLKGPLEEGAVIGVLENGAEGDETGLPPGKYNLYTAKVAGQWKTYAEAGGRIASEAIRTTVSPTDRAARPAFRTRGWCIITTMVVPQQKTRDASAYVAQVCF